MKLTLLSAEGQQPARVAVGGVIDQAQLSNFSDPLREVVGENVYARTVVIGMQGVEVLDSSGVGWLLSCHKRFRAEGGRFILHSLSPLARNVLRVLNMHLVFQIAKDETEALKLAAANLAK